MRRFALRIARVAVVAVSAGTLAAAGPTSPAEADQPLGRAGSAVLADPIIDPGVPATVYWPPPGPGIPGAVVEYRLTPVYWARFRDCRSSGSFRECADTVPAQYQITRTR